MFNGFAHEQWPILDDSVRRSITQIWNSSEGHPEYLWKNHVNMNSPPKKATWMIETCWAMLSLSSATHWIQGFPTEAGGFNKFLLDPSSQGPGRMGRSGDPAELQHGNGRNPFWMERYFREVSVNLNDGFSISNCPEVKVGPQDPPWKRMRLDSDGRFDQQWDFDQNG